MPYNIDETHDPTLESWVDSANDPATDFPIQNLPMLRFDRAGRPRAATRIGDALIDVDALSEAGLLSGHGELVNARTFASRGDRSLVRRRLVSLLSADNPELRDDGELRTRVVVPVASLDRDDGDGASIFLPPRDFTDFYASVHHATNVGSMFRPDHPLLPNYKWIPVGYHGRASSVVPSGVPVTRPIGQQAPADDDGGAPGFGPCTMLDYELEIGAVIGRGNTLGEPVSLADAEDHIAGLCLLNDWSARDLQKWEYQPLGPFLAKSFASTVSPYLVTMEALAPFRAPRAERAPGDPQPLAHLDSDRDRAHGAFDITVEAHIRTSLMREKDLPPHRVSKGNFRHMYWTLAQMLAHHTSNGCNLQTGDLMGSGTISGPSRESRGCLLEFTWDGDPFADPPVKAPGTRRTPIELSTGETRVFLGDHDEVILKAYCERDGFRRIGFGECSATVQPAPIS